MFQFHSTIFRIRRQIVGSACLLAFGILHTFAGSSAHAMQDDIGNDPVEVGVAMMDITPPIGFRTGGGYGEEISSGVHDPLFAKAIVIKQGSVAIAIVISDLLSVPPDLSQLARKQASELTKIPSEHIVIAATHNHGSPEYWGSLRDIFHEQAIAEHGVDPHETIEYQSLLVNAWRDSIVTAYHSRVPATLDILIPLQKEMAFNRRFLMRDGSVQFNPGRGNPDIVQAAGPVDEDLPVLLFRRATNDESPFAALTTFAMHTAVHGGTEFSGDFPAVLQSRLANEFGDEFVSIFAEGTAGDINHINVSDPDQITGREQVESIGNRLADTITSHIADSKTIESPSLAVHQTFAQAPFSTVDEERYQEARVILRDARSNRTPFMTLVEAWRDCHGFRYTRLYPDGLKPLEVQAVRLSEDTALVFLPHEIFVELGLAIKSGSPFRNTIVISLANDVDFYIPTRRAFEEGSYEVTTCPLSPGCGELLLDAAREALEAVKRGDETMPRKSND